MFNAQEGNAMTAKPATPLPYRIAVSHGFIVVTRASEGVDLNAKCLAKVEPNADAAAQRWCDIANAYPELVAALRRLQAAHGSGLAEYRESAEQARALLAKLGEGA